MGRGMRAAGITIVVVLVAMTLLGTQAGVWVAQSAVSDYDEAVVRTVDENGSYQASVDVRVADSFSKRYLGLSNTSSLAPDEGMLFTYESSGSHAYVMREMSFPLDIIYVGTNGTVTSIHHAPVHDGDGSLEEYSGTGQYVLEVDRGWTNRTDLQVGETVCVPDGR